MIEIATMFFLPLLVVLVPIYLGQRYGTYQSAKLTQGDHVPVGSAVGATFGLLAFMLAFTFQIAANRYDARKGLLLDEVTNIRTTYFRAGLIPEPFRNETKKLLLEYVDLRVKLAKDQTKLGEAMARSQQILDRLWHNSEAISEQDKSSESYSLFISSVNELVEVYNKRITMTFEYRIPPAILWVLFIITFLTMLALGYQFGISGKGGFKVNLLLAIVFAIVMFLILALDRPEIGLAKLEQKPIFTLQKQLQLMQVP